MGFVLDFKGILWLKDCLEGGREVGFVNRDVNCSNMCWILGWVGLGFVIVMLCI